MGCWRRFSASLRIKQPTLKACLAEFLGTFVLVAYGDGCVAQAVLSGAPHGALLSVSLGFGLAVAMGTYVAGAVSGGHVNPAVSLAFGIIGRLQWWKVPLYCLSQYLGAFAGAAAVFGVYSEALVHLERGNLTVVGTAQVFSTYPQDFISSTTGVTDQIVSTSLFLICVLAITDQKNLGVPRGLEPLCIGLVVTAIGLAFGFNCGLAINPARDLGPRLFTLAAGWGSEVFTYRNYTWFWVPVVGPHVGALLGCWLYLLFVGIHHQVDPLEKFLPDVPHTLNNNFGSHNNIQLHHLDIGVDNGSFDVGQERLEPPLDGDTDIRI